MLDRVHRKSRERFYIGIPMVQRVDVTIEWAEVQEAVCKVEMHAAAQALRGGIRGDFGRPGERATNSF